MLFTETPAGTTLDYEIKQLFYQRTLVCLWLGVVFFSLFTALDYVCWKEFFSLFLTYRLAFVVTLFCFLSLLRLPRCNYLAPVIIYAALLLGALTISLMTVKLGGFLSGYYVGILLMIAGGFSVLPLRLHEALFTGMSMYLVYIVTVSATLDAETPSQFLYSLNNSFFFFSIIGATAAQSHEDLKTHKKEIRAERNIQTIRAQLTKYTGGLEHLVQQRLQSLEESALKYRDLYNSILDPVVLIDRHGIMQKVNDQAALLLQRDPETVCGTSITDFLKTRKGEKNIGERLLNHLEQLKSLHGVQLIIGRSDGREIEVELNAGLAEIGSSSYYQLIFRNISEIKKMERRILDSERLTGNSRQAAIFGLARLAECRDDDTGAHLNRIRAYTRILTEELAKKTEYRKIITDDFVTDILHSAVLHDIGKVGIPDAILLKPGPLTSKEFEVMKHHCLFGSATLAAAEADAHTTSFLTMGQQIAKYHHERWDGTGYPEGLSGNDIPLAARIIALADVYDALTSARVYKPAYNHEKAKEIIMSESGRQFDPNLVNAFLLREEDFKNTRMHLLLDEKR